VSPRGISERVPSDLREVLEKLFVVLVLLYFSNGLTPFTQINDPHELDVTANGAILFVVQAIIYLIAFIFMFPYRRYVIVLCRKEKMLFLLMAAAVLSTVWSEIPGLTLRRSVILCATTVFGLYLATRYTLTQQLRLYAWTFSIGILLSFFFVCFYPQYGVMSGELAGAWKGAYTHKNDLGKAMSLGAVVFLFTGWTAERYRLVCWVGATLALTLIWESQSVTAIGICMTLVTIVLCLRFLHWKKLVAVVTLTMSVSVLAVMLLPQDLNILSSINKDITLTGRTELWTSLINKIARRPLLGYGYNGFWVGVDEGESGQVVHEVGWNVQSAHNGFLDLCLSLGLMGLLIFGLQFGAAMWRAFRIERSSWSAEGLWPATFLVFFLLYNLDESGLVEHNNAYWIIYVATVAWTRQVLFRM
jgi:exopolysaccharide production protein ExoQ